MFICSFKGPNAPILYYLLNTWLDALSLFKFTANLLFLIAPWRSMELCYSRGNDCEVGEGFQSISLPCLVHAFSADIQHALFNPLTLLNIGINTQSNFVLKMCPNYPLEAFE